MTTYEKQKIAELRQMIWNYDIPQPVTPESRAHHTQMQSLLAFIDAQLLTTGVTEVLQGTRCKRCGTMILYSIIDSGLCSDCQRKKERW